MMVYSQAIKISSTELQMNQLEFDQYYLKKFEASGQYFVLILYQFDNFHDQK